MAMERNGLTQAQSRVLGIAALFAPVTRRVLEYACLGPGTTGDEVDHLRQILGVLRGRGFLDRFRTVDAPKGRIEVVYTLAARGQKAAGVSREYRLEGERWLALEKKRPGLAGILPQLQLILSYQSETCRVIGFEAVPKPLTPGGELWPDVVVTVEHVGRLKRWRRRQVYFEFDLGPMPFDVARERYSAYEAYFLGRNKDAPVASEVGKQPPDTVGGVMVFRNQLEFERFIGNTTSLGWHWVSSGGLLEAMDESKNPSDPPCRMLAEHAGRWSEVLKVGPSREGEGVFVSVLRHPREIIREILGLEDED